MADRDVPVAAVREILADVRARGDAAVRELTERFDGVRLDDMRVPTADLESSLALIAAPLRDALWVAASAIADFHASERRAPQSYERDGVVVRTMPVPVDRAGCYVPGGRAVYPSTVLMTAIPARVAGVGRVVLCVPPDRGTGRVPDATLAAAAIAEVDEVYAIGGAQAIGAMAYGTESIEAVDVIVGPGNIYVALAKREVAGEGLVGIPSAFAGPSEVVVVADETTSVEHAAIDIVVQAEHGPHGLAWLITWSEPALAQISEAVDRLVARSPRRSDIEATLAEGGYAVLVDGPAEAMAVANAIAPEHLELMSADPEALVPLVRHAGAVFCGPWAPASVGDYLAGPSHVLPTFGSARFGQALTVDDFTKQVHVVTLDEAALAKVAPHVAALAEAEGLPAHAASVRMRTTEDAR
jgi:histidinol dehydrogenase